MGYCVASTEESMIRSRAHRPGQRLAPPAIPAPSGTVHAYDPDADTVACGHDPRGLHVFPHRPWPPGSFLRPCPSALPWSL